MGQTRFLVYCYCGHLPFSRFVIPTILSSKRSLVSARFTFPLSCARAPLKLPPFLPPFRRAEISLLCACATQSPPLPSSFPARRKFPALVFPLTSSVVRSTFKSRWFVTHLNLPDGFPSDIYMFWGQNYFWFLVFVFSIHFLLYLYKNILSSLEHQFLPILTLIYLFF